MKQQLSLAQPYTRAKVLGIILIIIGLAFFINPVSLNLKIGFTSILIGTIMIGLITKKSIPQEVSDEHIEGNLTAIRKIINELHLEGNAIFLPKSHTLTEERILIPPNSIGIIKIPPMDDNTVFLKGPFEENLGISIPPSGLKLLNEVAEDETFDNIGLENVEYKLQKFVGKDLLKSVSFSRQKDGWRLELEKPESCPGDTSLCNQYPCPTCSAVLSAIARSLKSSNKRMRINDTTVNGNKIAFNLSFLSPRIKRKKKR